MFEGFGAFEDGGGCDGLLVVVGCGCGFDGFLEAGVVDLHGPAGLSPAAGLASLVWGSAVVVAAASGVGLVDEAPAA